MLQVPQFFVKSPVFPFNKFPGVDPTLGPEMRSTGEVMGVGENFGEAFAKAQLSAGTPLPDKGRVFISVNDRDKLVAVALARRFTELGFEITATRGTAAAIRAAGIPVEDGFQGERRPAQRGGSAEGRLARSDHLHGHQRRARVRRRKSDPPQRGDVSRPVHHHHERRASGGGSHRVAAARSDPGVELAGNPRDTLGKRAVRPSDNVIMAETRRRDARREEPVETVPVRAGAVEETIEPKVSAILVGYNQAAALRRAIRGAGASKDRERLEILVVDCGSRDESSQLDTEFEGITMLRLPHHFGATKAMNIATRTAKAEIRFFLVAERRGRAGYGMQLAALIEERRRNGAAVCPLLVDPEGHRFRKIREIPTHADFLHQPARRRGPTWICAESVEVEYPALDALMIRKQFIKGMNYFDERFGNFWADADLAMQIGRAQRKVLLYPAIRATYHAAPDPLAGDPLLAADRALGAAAFSASTKAFSAVSAFASGRFSGRWAGSTFVSSAPW